MREEFDIFITPDGEQLDISRCGGKYYIFSGYSGVGGAPLSYQTDRGPSQHGVTVDDFRLDERIISMVIRAEGRSRQDYFDLGRQIMNLMRPNRYYYNPPSPYEGDPLVKTSTLRKIRPDNSFRDIDVLLLEGPRVKEISQDQWDEWSIQQIIRLLCPDPTYYDPETVNYSLTLGSVEYTQVPTRVPTPIGGSLLAQIINVSYDGDWPARPVITITGPGVDFAFINNTTGKTIQMSYIIVAGEIVTIDLTESVKRVTSSINGNIKYTVGDSDIDDMLIVPEPDAPNKINEIEIRLASATVASQIDFEFDTRYLSVF